MAGKMNGLDLFSGIGGLTIALKEWCRPVAYCEIDDYAQSIIFSRQATGELPYAPICTDIRDLRGSELPQIDIVWGGSPCQDLSCAGTRKGLEGERSGLFYEQIRVAREVKATWIFWENVGRAKVRDLVEVARVFRESGYTARAGVLTAMEIGALHQRRRIWVLAHREGRRMPCHGYDPIRIENHSQKKNRIEEASGHSFKGHEGNWEACANKLIRDTYGIPQGVDRIRGLGNAVVPLQAREAFKRLMGIREE